MTLFGSGKDTPEEHPSARTIDFLACLTAYVASGGAVPQKQITCQADIARSSLSAVWNMVQAQFMYDYAGRAAFNELSGRDGLASDAFYHCYEDSDGWFFFASPTEVRD